MESSHEDFRKYEPTRGAVQDARALGMGGDVAARIRRMARRSAPVTHEFANRRFEDFLMWVEDGRVLSVFKMET